jgi:hypothetical protein
MPKAMDDEKNVRIFGATRPMNQQYWRRALPRTHGFVSRVMILSIKKYYISNAM